SSWMRGCQNFPVVDLQKRALRSSSFTPTSDSRSRICRLNEACAVCKRRSAAVKKLPSWYVLATQDQTVPPDLPQSGAKSDIAGLPRWAAAADSESRSVARARRAPASSPRASNSPTKSAALSYFSYRGHHVESLAEVVRICVRRPDASGYGHQNLLPAL